MHDFEPEAHDAARGARHKAKEQAGSRSRPTSDPGGSAGMAASLLHLQRTVGNAGVVQLLADEESATSPVHDVVGRGGGTPLDESTRATMEGSFGQSFEDVRVHTGPQASKSAESVGANAYTVGSDIVFRAGQFDAGSATGQRTLAHELTHVVQQRSGPVDGTDAPGGIRLSDPSDKFERAAEQTAGEVMSGLASSSGASASTDTAQRELDEAAPVQATLQRDGVPEEEEQELAG